MGKGTGVEAWTHGQGNTGAREQGHWQGDDERAWHGLWLVLGWDKHINRIGDMGRVGRVL